LVRPAGHTHPVGESAIASLDRSNP